MHRPYSMKPMLGHLHIRLFQEDHTKHDAWHHPYSIKLLILFLATFNLLAQAQDLTQNSPGNQSSPLSPPVVSQTLAPALPEKPPLPAPPIVPPLPSFNILPKPSLAWRTIAAKLACQKFKNSFDKTTSGVFDASYSDALAALVEACSSSKLQIEVLDNNAGEVLASEDASSVKLVFSVSEITPGKTLISATTTSTLTPVLTGQIQSVLANCGNLLGKRGHI